MELVVYALIFADKVILEQGTGKKTVVGMFSEINAHNFPTQHPPWHILCIIGNLASGKHTFAINIVHEDSTQVIWSVGGEFTLAEGQNVADFSFEVVPRFPAEGSYTVSVHFDGGPVPVVSRALTVHKVEAPNS